MTESTDLPIIQKAYDLIKWYIPIINRLPREHKHVLGERLSQNLYDLLDSLIIARYAREKIQILTSLNSKIDVLRYQSRLLLDFGLMDDQRFAHTTKLITGIGQELGGWLKQQQTKQRS
jgi:hypothetical protein